jgi:hypothetical protein
VAFDEAFEVEHDRIFDEFLLGAFGPGPPPDVDAVPGGLVEDVTPGERREIGCAPTAVIRQKIPPSTHSPRHGRTLKLNAPCAASR